MIPTHQAPNCEVIFGDHDQCPRDWKKRDDALSAATQGPGLGMIIRVAGGYYPDDGLWSRTRCAFQWNNHLELGWAHFSAKKSWEFLGEVAKQLPSVAQFAFGGLAGAMADKGWQERMYKEVKGRKEHSSKYDPILAGWAQICGRADVQDLYARMWFKDFVQPVINLMERNGVRDCRFLALGARMLGTSPGNIDVLEDALRRSSTADEAFTYAANKYGKESRIDRLKKIVPGGCTLSRWPEPSDIRWPSTVSKMRADVRTRRPGDTGMVGLPGWAVPVLIAAVLGGGYLLWRRRA